MVRLLSNTIGFVLTITGSPILTRGSALRSEGGAVLVHVPSTSSGVLTAGWNSALPVKVKRRPVWNPSLIGDPVMMIKGGGTEGGGEINGHMTSIILIETDFVQ